MSILPNACTQAATMLSALFSNLWVIALIDLGQEQVYSFSTFTNNAIGIVGGVGVGVATLAFFSPAQPEHRFKGLLRTFLLRCERAIADMRPPPQREPGVSADLEARRAEWLELLSLCEMWAGQLDQRRHPEEERARLGRQALKRALSDAEARLAGALEQIFRSGVVDFSEVAAHLQRVRLAGPR